MSTQKPIVIVGAVGDKSLKVARSVWRQFLAAVGSWPAGMSVELEARPVAETRSGRANAYLFAVVYREIAIEVYGRATEAIKYEIHEAMKLRHNPTTITDPITKSHVLIGGSTRKLSIEVFGQYIEAVMLDGNGLGIVFPEPRKDEDWREPKGAAA